MFRRKPDEVIRKNYLQRWHLIPHNKYLNIYLHKFTGSDEDRAFHDHPWHSVSFLLKGNLTEFYHGYWTQAGNFVCCRRRIKKYMPYFRKAREDHRLELPEGCDEVITLFIKGPKIRDWGFITEQGWVYWETFLETFTEK